MILQTKKICGRDVILIIEGNRFHDSGNDFFIDPVGKRNPASDHREWRITERGREAEGEKCFTLESAINTFYGMIEAAYHREDKKSARFSEQVKAWLKG